MSYVVHASEGLKDAVYTPYGGCAEFFYCKDAEFIAEGPAETGKTLAACWKAHLLSLKYAGSNGAIVRKTQKSIYGTVLQTFDRVIKDSPVRPFGGEKPEKYIYPNGSTIWIGGMDNPDKVLSSERDWIYVNQAEELTPDDWEKMLTRTTGRGSVMPYTMLFGDCNPGGSMHWIRKRKGLRLIRTTHRDNPTLYNQATGELTEQGKRTMARLDSLTGVRRKRLKDGIWATAEGAVYDNFDVSVHVKERNPSEMLSWYLAQDEGYTNPAVILLVGIDNDSRWHVAKEWYESGKLQSKVVEQAKRYCDVIARYGRMNKSGVNIGVSAVDKAAAGLIADLQNNNIPALGAKGRVLDGIQRIQDRLKVAGDGRPGITIDPSCVNTINEFESYVWKQNSAGISKDEPVKENDHAMDALRYLDEVAEGTWHVLGDW